MYVDHRAAASFSRASAIGSAIGVRGLEDSWGPENWRGRAVLFVRSKRVEYSYAADLHRSVTVGLPWPGSARPSDSSLWLTGVSEKEYNSLPGL